MPNRFESVREENQFGWIQQRNQFVFPALVNDDTSDRSERLGGINDCESSGNDAQSAVKNCESKGSERHSSESADVKTTKATTATRNTTTTTDTTTTAWHESKGTERQSSCESADRFVVADNGVSEMSATQLRQLLVCQHIHALLAETRLVMTSAILFFHLIFYYSIFL